MAPSLMGMKPTSHVSERFVGLLSYGYGFFYSEFRSWSLFMTAATLPLEGGKALSARVARKAPAIGCKGAGRTGGTSRGSVEDHGAMVGVGVGGI